MTQQIDEVRLICRTRQRQPTHKQYSLFFHENYSRIQPNELLKFRRKIMQMKYNTSPSIGSTISTDLRKFMSRVFMMMSLGLCLTALSAFAVVSMEGLFLTIVTTPLYYLLTFGAIGISLYMSTRFDRMKLSTIQNLYWIYSIIMGMSLSVVIMVYTGESIVRTFLIAAAVFLSASIYGSTTKRDLTYIGMFLIMGVIGIFIASIVNIFMHSTAMEFAISFIGVIVFTGLTAFDVQRISYYHSHFSGDDLNKVAVMGALSLYINFINLFLSLLRFFGNRRD